MRSPRTPVVNRLCLTVAAILVALTGGGSLHAQQETVAVDISELGAGFDYTQGSYSLGWRFTATKDVTVTALGFYDDLKDGIVGSHPVGIFDVQTRQLLVSGTVQPTDPLTGFFRYTAITPTVLTGGRDYYIQAVTFTDHYAVGVTSLGVDPSINFVGYAGGSASLSDTTELICPDPSFDDTGFHGDFGPNFKLMANSAPAVPVITSAASASGQVGVPFVYQITAANAPVSFGTSTLPPGLRVDIPTGLLSGTPTQAGTFPVTLFAANAAGTGTGTLTLSFSTLPAQPTLAIVSPPDHITVLVGAPVPLAASVTDPAGVLASVDFLVNGLPVGRVTGSAGPFTATAAAPAPGVYTLQAVATDTLGRTSTSTVTVTALAADPANPAPTAALLTPLDGRDLAAGTLLTLSATADAATAAGLDHASIYVDGTLLATFDSQGNLVGTQGSSGSAPTRQDASTTPLSKVLTTSYRLPALDKLLTMIVTATDKLGRTSVSGTASFHSKLTSNRAPLVSFANASLLANLPVGSTTLSQILASDPDAGTNSTVVPAPGLTRQDGTTDGILAQLEYWINGINITKTPTSPLRFTFTPPAAGKYVLHAVATDGSGLTTISDPVVVEAAIVVPTVTVMVAGDGMAIEGGENGKATVRRTGDISAPLTVRYKVKGAAKSGVDYKPVTGTLTIPAAQAQAKIKLKPLNNSKVDGTRIAKIKLLPSMDNTYTLGASVNARLKIIDNDTAP